MRLFAIGDLHLSGAVDKPMDVFGPHWTGHDVRIRQSWLGCVGEEDVVLLPGDFSWAMTIEEVKADFAYLAQLPGKKVLIRGNHDYWWSSLQKVRAILPENTFVLQNDCISFGDVHIAGTRGWVCPGSVGFAKEDEKLYLREANRLKLSLAGLPKAGKRVVMLHFPPFNEKREESAFSSQCKEAGVDLVLYGHLHARSCKHAFEGLRDGVMYRLVSADHIDFTPVPIEL